MEDLYFGDLAVMLQLEYFARIVIAALCGAAIGYERENRLKIAGIRTHLIVAIGASLMMVISKYGFQDMLGDPGIGLDPSRIAAGVIASIGFLGAGVIFMRNRENISGITTAAGLWATMGIGLATGAGMYLIGIGITLLILVAQIALHKNSKLTRETVSGYITLRGKNAPELDKRMRHILHIHSMEIVGTRVTRLEDGELELRLQVKCAKIFDVSEMIRLLSEIPGIQSIEI